MVMSRMIRASIERAPRSGEKFVTIKWRLHVGGTNFLVPAMRMVLPVNVAEDLRDALAETLRECSAAPSAKTDSRHGRPET